MACCLLSEQRLAPGTARWPLLMAEQREGQSCQASPPFYTFKIARGVN